ncbi:MAG: feruloyl-CoA synthase [Alphaproteobacteria bacterium]|jgi:feruloyl-CoA synthase|nr:feruloyl-CoA synthase [Alphaproteobacteria bacterium]
MRDHRATGLFAPCIVERRPTADGMVLTSGLEPGQPADTVIDLLEAAATAAPDRAFLAERDGHGWRRVAYGDAARTVGDIARNLVARGLTAERPLAILSDNAINHALLALGAMAAGVPVAQVSPAYSRFADQAKLEHIFAALTPGLVYAADGTAYGAALTLAVRLGIATATDADFAALAAPAPGPLPTIGPDTVAKVLFTSGSTNLPKGVITTHRMMCSNQEALARIWPFLAEEPPIMVDWLPWNHVFGGSFVTNLVLRHQGTLHIDAGRPVAALIDKTLDNLREIAPTIYCNVPRGFDLLVRALDHDDELARRFFSHLRLIFSAGAALPENLWQRLTALAERHAGKPVPIISGWGATETAPCVTAIHFDGAGPGNIGVPLPGAELKFRPSGDRWEMRVRGPMVSPGYWRRPDLTAAAFDEDGFYRIGDAGKLADPQDPARGILFDGRVVEDFKLSSGTWVNVGKLRLAAIAAASPAIEDAVVTGHDRDEIGLLLFPSLAGCRRLCDAPAAELAELAGHPALRDHLRTALARLGRDGGSSTRVARALILTEPPSVERGEITDKGYLNQRIILTGRAEAVERLYAGQDIIEIKQ